jgi:hypothetical protein
MSYSWISALRFEQIRTSIVIFVALFCLGNVCAPPGLAENSFSTAFHILRLSSPLFEAFRVAGAGTGILGHQIRRAVYRGADGKPCQALR